MSKQFEEAFAAYQGRQNRPWVARQPWYIKALIYGFIAGWFAACTFVIGAVVIAAVS
jgi:hypothetical protein